MSRRIPLLAAAVAGLLVGAGPPDVGAQTRDELLVEGEYGLFVTDADGGGLHVGWLTGEDVAGVLEVHVGDERLHRFETPAAQAHAADFPRPDRGPVRLRYGRLEDEAAGGAGLHTTSIHLDEGEGAPPGVLTGVDSLFAVGDVHGEYDTLLRLLGSAGLVDGEGRWTGGRRHVAFLGDLFDRGADVTRTLWFLYRLEREAAAAGGGAHVILGNHETMVFTDDLRYVASKERLVASLHGTSYPRLFDVRRSVLGRWLAARPGLMKVDGALLAHGGVGPDYAAWGVEEFNDSLRAFMAEDLFYYMGPIFDTADSTAALVLDPALADRVRAEHVVVMDSLAAQRRLDFFFAENSVFWYRDYLPLDEAADTAGADTAGADTVVADARESGDSLPAADRRARAMAAILADVLARHGARVHVVGHTPVAPVQSRYGGGLVAVDLREPATEMALLVRDGEGGYRAFRYTLEGPVGPLPEGPVAGGGAGPG